MTESGRGWRALPGPLLLGLGLHALHLAGTALITVRYRLRDFEDFTPPPRWTELAMLGTELAAHALLAVGAIELARRYVAGARRGLQIAALGGAAMTALALIWFSSVRLQASSIDFKTDHWVEFQRHAWYVASWLPFLGLAIAAWIRRRRGLAVGSLVVVALTHPPSFVWRWIALDYKVGMVLSVMLTTVQLAQLMVLATAVASDTTEAPEPEHVIRGLRRAARSLRVRILTSMIAGLLGIVSASRSHHSSTAVLAFVAVAAAVITCAAFGWLAAGVFGMARGRPGERHRLAFAGAAATWCCAVTTIQLLCLYKQVYGAGVRDADDIVGQLTFAIPVLEIVSVAVLIATIGAIARERELMKLYEDAFSRRISVVFLLLVAAALHVWGLPAALVGRSPGMVFLAAGAAVVCWLLGLSMAARLCRDAAEALDQAPGLPSARIESSRRDAIR